MNKNKKKKTNQKEKKKLKIFKGIRKKYKDGNIFEKILVLFMLIVVSVFIVGIAFMLYIIISGRFFDYIMDFFSTIK